MAGTDNPIIEAAARKISPVQLDEVSQEELLTDAYYGTGGFANGDYLVPHRREDIEKLNDRKRNAYYLNYVAPVINSHVDPIFRKAPNRDWKNNELFGKFTQDVDMMGTTLHKFMKLAGIIAKMLGVCFIAVDNFPEQPQSLADVINNRLFPYAYILEPSRVKKYTTNRFGQLISITYTIPEDATDSDKQPKMNLITWTTSTWVIKDVSGSLISEGTHTLGRIPVTALFARQVRPGQYKPQSEYFSIARANARIYNLCSELDEILRNQAFSILTYPGGTNNKNTEIRVGTENVLGYDPNASHTPAFIAPPSDPAKLLMEQIDRIIKEIYRMAGLSHVTGVETAQSGVAKQYDFQKANEGLADFADNCEKTEKDIADIFMRWTGSSFDYSVDYGDDFGIEDVMEELDKAMSALNLEVGGEFNMEVKKQVARIYFAHTDDKRLAEILDDIEVQHEDQLESEELDKDLETQNKELDLDMKKKQAKQPLPAVQPKAGN